VSVIGLIAKYATGTYEVTRRPKGVRVDGVYQPSNAPQTLEVVMRLRPATGRELKDLDEGQRADEVKMALSTVELKTRTKDFDADIVKIDGEDWRVDNVKNPQAFGDTHYRCLLVRTARP
jgi:hypothetical protein